MPSNCVAYGTDLLQVAIFSNQSWTPEGEVKISLHVITALSSIQ